MASSFRHLKLVDMCSELKKIYDLTDLLTFTFSKKALFYRPLTGRRYTEAARISTYVFDVDVSLFTEDARVACAAISKSVSLTCR